MKQLTEEQIEALRSDARMALEVVQGCTEPEDYEEELKAANAATTMDDFAKVFCDAAWDAESFVMCAAAALGREDAKNEVDAGNVMEHWFTQRLRDEYGLTFDLGHFST